jgi:pimeloyl-ACP methyl ester carboxylesterase
MKSILIAMALSLALCGPAVQAQAPSDQAFGDWRGSAAAGAVKLRVALHLGASSTFDSPDQGANGIPAELKVTGSKLVMTIPGVGVFEGEVSADGKQLDGVLKQGSASIPVRLERGVFASARRPQTPVGPFPYSAREASYVNPKQADVRLAGTLTVPKGRGPFPAVLLITGSGPQDRDETVFEHKPFLVVADALTRRGVAVLRVDDRGVGGSSPGPRGATTADFATDVEASLAWLRKQKDIDSSRVGLLGHSEGAVIASAVAGKDHSLDFVVLWAGSGVSGKEILVEQARALSRSSGAPPEAVAKVAAVQSEVLGAVLAEPTAEGLRSSLQRITASRGVPAISAGAADQLGSPWYRHFLAFDPSHSLRKARTPVLALLGGTDLQVSADQNAPALRAALRGNRHATVEVLPGLNHLFQTSKTGAPSEYGKISETISPAALTRMTAWIVDQTKRSAR